MHKLIKKDTSYTYDEDTNIIDLSGTKVNELGDLLADALLLVPEFTEFGAISKGAYIQALEVYNKIIDKFDTRRPLYINGYSLGGGVAQILTLLVHHHFFHSGIILSCRGSIKVLGSKARRLLKNARLISIESYDVRYKDPVPMLGWWLEPKHNTARTGNKKKHPFDYDPREHERY